MNSSLESAVAGFLAGQAGEVSPSTRRWYAQRLHSFLTFAGPVCPCAVSAGTIRAYRAHLVDAGLSASTVHGHQRALRRFFGWLTQEGAIPRNVAADVPLVRIPPQPPKALTDDDLLSLTLIYSVGKVRST